MSGYVRVHSIGKWVSDFGHVALSTGHHDSEVYTHYV